MIFGNKKSYLGAPPIASGPNGDPWDVETIEWLNGTKAMDLRITHIERRFRGGPDAPPSKGNTGNPEVIVSGYVYSAPQHVYVQIEFNEDLPAYGEGWLTFYVDQEYPGGQLNLPYLGIRLQDKDHSIRIGLAEALREAIAAGRNEGEARAFIQRGDKWDEIVGGHSRTLDIKGVIVWAHTKAPSLPSWALPLGELDLDGFPFPNRLRSTPKN